MPVTANMRMLESIFLFIPLKILQNYKPYTICAFTLPLFRILFYKKCQHSPEQIICHHVLSLHVEVCLYMEFLLGLCIFHRVSLEGYGVQNGVRMTIWIVFNILRPRQNGLHFAGGISKFIFVNENCILRQISLFPMIQYEIVQHWSM